MAVVLGLLSLLIWLRLLDFLSWTRTSHRETEVVLFENEPSDENDPSEWILHRMAPEGSLERWEKYIATWDPLLDERDTSHRRWRNRTWRDADFVDLLTTTVPQYTAAILAMRAPVERNDMARYVALYRYGGVYVDLDVNLHSKALFAAAASPASIVLPFEKGRLVGQSIMLASRPRHPFWLHLIDWLVSTYDSNCYEPTNTGPDALTTFWNLHCIMYGVNDEVVIAEGFMSGPITSHRATGSWTHVGDSTVHRMRSVVACPHKKFAWLNKTRCGKLRAVKEPATPDEARRAAAGSHAT